MKLEHYSVKKLKQEIREIVARYLDLSQYRIFFFGSRVTGKSTERSDIDIGIQGCSSEVDLSALAKIREEVDNLPLLYKVDVVDLSSDSILQEEALKKIELIAP